MSISLKKLDSNDFWNDCLKENKLSSIKKNNTKSTKNLTLNPLINYCNRARRNNKIYKYQLNPSFQKSQIIQRILKSEEDIKAINEKKNENSIKYLNALYTRGMFSKEKKKKTISLYKEERLSAEKQHKIPTIYKNKGLQNKIKKNFGKLSIYERNVKYQQKRTAKVAKLFEENNKRINIVYPFHPNISFKNLNHVFFSDNYCKEQTANDSNKFFLSRLMKAREEEEYKKNIYEITIRKKSKYNWGNNLKLKKSLSQKDSIMFRKKLHNSLINLKFLPTNGDNNDNDNDKLEEYFLN
jgi:hypothetical protein